MDKYIVKRAYIGFMSRYMNANVSRIYKRIFRKDYLCSIDSFQAWIDGRYTARFYGESIVREFEK